MKNRGSLAEPHDFHTYSTACGSEGCHRNGSQDLRAASGRPKPPDPASDTCRIQADCGLFVLSEVKAMAENDSTRTSNLTRREALKIALAAAGGVLTGVSLDAAAATFAGLSPDGDTYLDEDGFHRLEGVCDILLPESDTPGALAAGVPNFIDHLLANWASFDSQERFALGLDSVEHQAHTNFGASFTRLNAAQRFQVLREVDIKAMSSADHPFRLVKKLVIFGYYTSEAGGSEELRFDPVPGKYQCTPVEEDERAWSTNRWRNDL